MISGANGGVRIHCSLSFVLREGFIPSSLNFSAFASEMVLGESKVLGILGIRPITDAKLSTLSSPSSYQPFLPFCANALFPYSSFSFRIRQWNGAGRVSKKGFRCSACCWSLMDEIREGS